MKRYVVYDDTGNILKWGLSANIDVKLQAGSGKFVKVVAEVWNKLDITHKIKLGTTHKDDRLVVKEKKISKL